MLAVQVDELSVAVPAAAVQLLLSFKILSFMSIHPDTATALLVVVKVELVGDHVAVVVVLVTLLIRDLPAVGAVVVGRTMRKTLRLLVLSVCASIAEDNDEGDLSEVVTPRTTTPCSLAIRFPAALLTVEDAKACGLRVVPLKNDVVPASIFQLFTGAMVAIHSTHTLVYYSLFLSQLLMSFTDE